MNELDMWQGCRNPSVPCSPEMMSDTSTWCNLKGAWYQTLAYPYSPGGNLCEAKCAEVGPKYNVKILKSHFHIMNLLNKTNVL